MNLELDTSLLSDFADAITARENRHLLGSSPIIEALLKLSNYTYLNAKEKAALAYFLPLANWMKEDWNSIARCFEIILGLPENDVKIVEKPLFHKTINQASINTWRIEINTIIGGMAIFPDPFLTIEIIVSNKDLEEYIEDGVRRNFLEHFLYPAFLKPVKYYSTKIVLDEKQSGLIIEDHPKSPRIGINTIIRE